MSNVSNFKNLNLSPEMLKTLKQKGYEAPTQIQEFIIPFILTGDMDIIGQASSGTGKTASYAIPIVEKIKHNNNNSPQVLILAPHREQTIQICEEVNSLLGTKHLLVDTFYGGQDVNIQLRKLHDGVDIAIGTPDRIFDLRCRERLNFDQVKYLILDGFDDMIELGHYNKIKKILEQAPKNKMTLLLAATAISEDERRFAEDVMRDFKEYIAVSGNPTGAITQEYYNVQDINKPSALARIIDLECMMHAVVYCQSDKDVDDITGYLQERGFSAEALHDNLGSSQRIKIINKFERQDFQVLITTEEVAEDLDVDHLSHVINYSVPQNAETYLSRMKKTEQDKDNQGTIITFVDPDENRTMSALRKNVPFEIEREDLPTGREIVNAKKIRIAKVINAIIEDGDHEVYLDYAEQLLSEEEDAKETIAAMLRMKFSDELLESNYRDLSKSSEALQENIEMVKLQFSVGKEDDYGVVKLLDLIYDRAGIRNYHLGNVKCLDDISIVEAKPKDAKKIIRTFRRHGSPKVELLIEEEESGIIEEAIKRQLPTQRRFLRRRIKDIVTDADIFIQRRGSRFGRRD